MKLSPRTPSRRSSIASTAARVAGAGAVAAGGLLLATAPAHAAGPTGYYADFDQCPLSAPGLTSCIVNDTTSGAIKLGSQNVPITKTLRLQGGTAADPDTGEETFYPAKNGKTLSRVALNVPGGLAGITIPSSVPQPVRGYLQAGIDTVNGVTATAELVGPVEFSLGNFINVSGRVAKLPLRIKLDNPFLGSNCYIGSAASPVNIELTVGDTTPPAGVAPLTGSQGDVEFLDNAQYVKATNVSLVGNTFSAPKASGCGGIFSWAIDPVVNLKLGLPTSAGQNQAVLNGSAQVGDVVAVTASTH